MAGGTRFTHQMTLLVKSDLCREREGRDGLKASHQLWASQLCQAWLIRREKEVGRAEDEEAEAAGSEPGEAANLPISSS